MHRVSQIDANEGSPFFAREGRSGCEVAKRAQEKIEGGILNSRLGIAAKIRDRRATLLPVTLVAVIAVISVPMYGSAAAERQPVQNLAETSKNRGTAVLSADMAEPSVTSSSSERICVGSDCGFATLQKALAAALPGAIVTLKPGIYKEAAVESTNNIVIKAAGAHLEGVAAEGKAALVIKGTGVTIEGLECSDIRVPDGNGACIRIEGGELVLRNMHIHHCEMGILGRGDLTIEDSTIDHIGVEGSELGHGVYSVGHQLTIRRSRILASGFEGHEVKSRSENTLIEDSVIASIDGVDSRQIDVPDGGTLIVRNSVIEKGPHSVQTDLIGYGLERRKDKLQDHRTNSIVIEGNTIIVDRPGSFTLLRTIDADSMDVHDNKIVGGPINAADAIVGGPPGAAKGNHWYRDRATAGLPAIPDLPPPGNLGSPR